MISLTSRRTTPSIASCQSLYKTTYPSPPPGLPLSPSRQEIIRQTEPVRSGMEDVEDIQNLSPSTEANRAVAFSVAESVLGEDYEEADGIDQRIRALERRMNNASNLSAAAVPFEFKVKADDADVKHSRSRSDTYVLNTPVESSDSFDLPPPRCMTPLPFKRPSLLPPAEVKSKSMPTLAEISARYPGRSNKRNSLESIDSFGSFSDPSLPSTPRKSRLPAFLRHGRTNSTSSSASDDVVLYSPTEGSFDNVCKTPETYPTLRVTPPSVEKGSLLPTITCTPATALGSATASPLAMLEAQVRDDKIRVEKRRIMFSTLQRRHRSPGVAV